MSTQKIFERKWSAKLVALVATAAVVLVAIAVHIGSALAAPPDLTVTLQNETGVSSSLTVEVGQTLSLKATYLYIANSADPSVFNVTYTAGNPGDLYVKGLKAGVAGVALGSYGGASYVANYLCTDSNNVSAYVLKQSGQVYFSGPNMTKSTPMTVTAGNISTVKWRSLDTTVATVNANTGVITSVGKGAAIILGEFIDKWGVNRDVHVLVSVGVPIGNGQGDLSELMDLINKGEWTLSQGADSPYTADSLIGLSNAVTAGKAVVNMTAPSASDIQNAINGLNDAFAKLVKKTNTNPNIIKGPDGNYYLPVGDPKNVYMIVNQDGTTKYMPPKYVYNTTGTPGNGADKPAYLGGDSDNAIFRVEDPANIFKQVQSDGSLKDSPAVWGGADGKLGGGDDQDVILYNNGSDNGYWVNIGQNVFRKYQPSAPRILGPLTGGGTDENPSTNPVTQIYEQGGKYYVGPLGPTYDQYFYGDSTVPGKGDGKLNSEANIQHATDDIFKMGTDGKLVTWDPNAVKSVAVVPQTLNIQRGSNPVVFSAQLTLNDTSKPVQNGPVTWSISPSSAYTSINSSGVLTVGASETIAMFTVRATSTSDPTKYGEATVNVTGIAPPVLSVNVDPQAATVGRNTSKQFTAAVTLSSGVDTDGVTWSVNSMNPGTTISASGLLFVAPNESANQLTVKAVARKDGSTYGTATVTVVADPESVGSVDVTPKTTTGYLGGQIQFTAKVTLNSGQDGGGVTWTVSPSNPGTGIDSTGKLTISANETSSMLTVTAKAVKDGSTTGVATVAITIDPTGIRDIQIAPQNPTVEKGATQTFTASVYQNNGMLNIGGVTWTVSPAANGTSINAATGVLTVGANDSAGSLTVTATSKIDATKSGNTNVTLKSTSWDQVNIGGTIMIDGMSWTKIKQDSTGKFALLILNDVLPFGAIQYDPLDGFTGEYIQADIHNRVDAWYEYLNAPTLKQHAWSAMMGTDDNLSWPAPTQQGGYAYAFIPKVGEMTNLTASMRDLGKTYWTGTKTKYDAHGGAVGYQVTVLAGGDWSMLVVQQTACVRPAIWVVQKL